MQPVISAGLLPRVSYPEKMTMIPLLEALEPRIAPATFTFTDVDGDTVTIKTTHGSDAELAAILTFENEGVGKQLQTIDFSANAAVFQGTSLTITAKPSGSLGGDGFVNVGLIDASALFNGGNNLNLGKIVIHGDLGRILAGTDAASVSVASLNVQSMGIYGTSTQEGAGSYQSSLLGSLGSLVVKGDFQGVDFWVEGNDGIKNVSVGGSVIGTDAGVYAGSIYASESIGKVTIGGSLIGGASNYSGTVISSANHIGSISIGGSMVGGAGDYSGAVEAESIGNIVIGRDIRGGSGFLSGSITAQDSNIGKLSVGGSVLGGDGESSGSIFASLGKIAGVSIAGDFAGGDGKNSASILAEQAGAISVGGSFIGGIGKGSAQIEIDTSLASFSLGGSLIGYGFESATLTAGQAGKISIGGSVLANGGLGTAKIFIDTADSLSVAKDVVGGFQNSGVIVSDAIGKVNVGGSLMGFGANTGQILLLSSSTFFLGGDLIGGYGLGAGKIQAADSSLHVGGSIFGGLGDGSGSIISKAAKISVGSIVGGEGPSSGGIGLANSAQSFTIRGSILGSSGPGGGGISLLSGVSGTLVVQGSIHSPEGLGSGFIFSNAHSKSIVIQGSLLGSHHGVVAFPILMTKSIDSLTIHGSIRGSLVDDASDIVINGNVGKLHLGGSLFGGIAETGRIEVSGNVGSMTIGGSLLGNLAAANQGSAAIEVGTINSLLVQGSVIGKGFASGSVSSDVFGKIDIRGSLISDSSGAFVFSNKGSIGDLSIGGSVHGGWIISADGGGKITIAGDLQARWGGEALLSIGGTAAASVHVGGSLVGGGVGSTGSMVFSSGVGSVTIGGSVIGGGSSNTGSIQSGGETIALIKIGQSLISGTKGFNNGSILTEGHVGALSIGGDMRGGIATGANNLSYSGSILAGSVGSLSIGRSIFSATDDTTGLFQFNSHIRVANDIDSLSIGGSIHGTADVPILITAKGQEIVPLNSTTDVAIGSVTIGGSIYHTNILAGYNQSGSGIKGNGGVNADAQIGKIVIGGDAVSSNLVAGVATGADGIFGTADDVALAGGNPAIVSRIAQILVGGQARASVDPSVAFGWVAQWLPTVKIGTNTLPLTPGPGNDLVPVNVSGNLDGNAREVAI